MLYFTPPLVSFLLALMLPAIFQTHLDMLVTCSHTLEIGHSTIEAHDVSPACVDSPNLEDMTNVSYVHSIFLFDLFFDTKNRYLK